MENKKFVPSVIIFVDTLYISGCFCGQTIYLQYVVHHSLGEN